MKETIINSRDNALVKRARAVRQRKLDGLIFVEGVRLCEEALGARLPIEDVLCTERVAQDERGARLLQALGAVCERIAILSEQVFASVSDTKSPQGIALILLAKNMSSTAAITCWLIPDLPVYSCRSLAQLFKLNDVRQANDKRLSMPDIVALQEADHAPVRARSMKS